MDEIAFPDEAITFAFQPIVNVVSGTIISFEALVRGTNNESAAEVLASIPDGQKQFFDNELRLAAIRLATSLGIQCHLNLNILPNTLHHTDDGITSTLEMAKQCGLTPSQLTFELTESEIIADVERFGKILEVAREVGLKISIDDFGAGYCGLNLLADFRPDSIKIDMSLVRDIETDRPRQAMIRGVACTCQDLAIDMIAEGVETEAEYWWFRNEGLELFQGYLFAKPGFAHLPQVHFPSLVLAG